MTGLKITLILRLLRWLKNVFLISTRITYLSNAERKFATESVVEWGFSLLMKMGSKIRTSVVFFLLTYGYVII